MVWYYFLVMDTTVVIRVKLYRFVENSPKQSVLNSLLSINIHFCFVPALCSTGKRRMLVSLSSEANTPDVNMKMRLGGEAGKFKSIGFVSPVA